MILDLERSSVPFTYRFLGLRLRLAFTRRRFERVEASYLQHLTTTAFQTARLIEERDQVGVPMGQARNEQDEQRELMEVLESSFTSLRSEIDRIEESQEQMKERALPLVRKQLTAHKSFILFLSGFKAGQQNDADPTLETCALPMLDQGDETTTAIKKLIASFSGVPIGMYVHDLRTLETLLENSNCEVCHDDNSSGKVSHTEDLTSVDESSVHEIHIVELEASTPQLDDTR